MVGGKIVYDGKVIPPIPHAGVKNDEVKPELELPENFSTFAAAAVAQTATWTKSAAR